MRIADIRVANTLRDLKPDADYHACDVIVKEWIVHSWLVSTVGVEMGLLRFELIKRWIVEQLAALGDRRPGAEKWV